MRIVPALVLTAVIAAVVGVAPTRPSVADAAASTDLLVGDSVMAGMSSDVRSSLPHHVFDAKVCRRLVSTSCSYRGVRPAPALNVIRSWSGVTDRAIVVAAGYNDGAIGSAVDAVVAEARRQGVPHVVWLTYRVAGNNAGIYRSHNSVLWQKATQYPELTIADWASYSAGRSSWVAADGLHLTGSGARAMADLIRVALAGLPLPGPPPLEPGADACFAVAGAAGGGAIVNLTPVEARAPGHGVLTSSAVPGSDNASNVNYAPGTVDPNLGVAPIGSDGAVCYRNADITRVHLVADHLATIAPDAYTAARQDGLPDRRLGTRTTGVRVAPGGHVCFAVSGAPGDAALVNLTPVLAGGPGHGVLTSTPDDPAADASNVNFTAGSVDPNLAVAPIGPAGQVCFHASEHHAVDLVADHLGTIAGTVFTPAAEDGTPDRSVDTRNGAPVPPGGRVCFDVEGAPGDAAIVNLTPVQATTAGHGVLVSSSVATAPTASHVNFRPGSVDPNVALAPIGTDGRVCWINSEHASVHLVADVLGVVDASAVVWPNADGAPDRRIDTRVE